MVFKLSSADSCRYPSDVKRICDVAISHGIVLSPQEAEKAWEEYSDMLCAGWINLPEGEEEIWNSLPMWARGEEEN